VKAAFLAIAAFATGGCVSLPKARTNSCAEAPRPDIALSGDGKTASTRLDVLTYNVEGLPKLTRKGRRDPLQEIGEHLRRMRADGTAPQVVMLQEVFSRRARSAVIASGYPSLAPGPSAGQTPPAAVTPRLPGRRKPKKGELGLKVSSSGLVIAADFPLVEARSRPFRRGSCAGIDCLANKGIALARMSIPGVPAPIDLYTTHMNSTGASRVPEPRHLAAHNKQAAEIAAWVREQSRPELPVLFGGDFNMRGSPERFEHFIRLHTLRLVHVHCLENPESCDVRMSWDGDAPWMDTQDLQLFASGSRVRLRPVRVEAMFDGREASPRLSDHDGFRVVYELSWPAEDTLPGRCAPAPST
jgi:endonuclease/exonuclease/phosphatase family metal-dependent hydrolase